ncbi:hypothetical protein HK105_209215 [Polyrhizophydium stewartii]|uniref:Gluconokinase n=1 Tax=Polyrhizophydium stewartii TaxID=2732419 RepID=A0ABR4MVP9_9FUNG
MSAAAPDAAGCVLYVMGVSGSGKSTVAAAVCDALSAQGRAAKMLDADDLHPPANVAKMRRGEGLNDEDRWPWLRAVAAAACSTAGDGVAVVACSALRRAYRDALRAGSGGRRARFVHLAIPETTARSRSAARTGHFAGPTLAASQFAALEPPATDEADAASVDATRALSEVVRNVLAAADLF